MHAVKVGWGGQTFALAKCSDSSGKKSRIRRSKEERKSMVESFIQKYQKSNNGNFPSLNLTHKEVGGSFYTVREIVREIIQENRVLGPAKLTVDEQKKDQFSELYPLESISTSSSTHFSLSSDVSEVISNDPLTVLEEPIIIASDGEPPQHHQQRVDNVGSITGNLVDQQYMETDTSKSSRHSNAEMQHVDAKISHERVWNSFDTSSHFTPTATDIVVETFPIKSAAIMTQASEANSGIVGLDALKKEVEKASELEKPGDLLDKMGSMAKEATGCLEEKSVVEFAHPLFESPSSSLMKNSRTDSVDGSGLQVDLPCNDNFTPGAANNSQWSAGTQFEPKPAPADGCTKAIDTNNSTSNCGDSLLQEAILETKADARNSLNNDEGRSSTLNRAKLESWEEVSKSPAREDENPIFAVFKAFISAFVKFWTE